MSIYRAQTMTLYLLVLSALGTVFTADAFEWPLALGIFAATCASLVVPYRLRAAWARSRMVIVALLLLLASVVSEVYLGNRDIVSGATLFLVLVLVSRLYTPRTSSDAIQVLTLSFVVVLAGSALNTSFAFAPYFVLVIICSIWSLTTTHLTKTAESRPEKTSDLQISRRFWVTTSALAIVIFLQTTVFFVVFPRMGLGYFKPKVRSSQNAVGFSDRVSLGEAGTVQDDGSVVVRLEFPNGLAGHNPEHMYFRGATLDRFDGEQWSKIPHGQQAARYLADNTFETRPVERDAKLHFNFYQEPTDAEYVFFPEVTPVARLTQENPLWSGRPRIRFYTDTTGDVMMVRPVGLAVQLEGWLLDYAPVMTPPAPETLFVPPLDERIADQAKTWRGDALAPEAIVERLIAGLSQGFSYSLTLVAPPAGESALAFFLFDRKAGHCEYFASALAVMLRQSGVPSRMVTGYRGASFNEYGGYYSVQEYRAHTWVEYYVQGRGWLRADPTPTSTERDPTDVLERFSAMSDLLRYRWNRYVVEYDLDIQVDALRSIRKGMRGSGASSSDAGDALGGSWKSLVLAAAAFALIVTAMLMLRRRFQDGKTVEREASRLFARMEKALSKSGVGRRPPSLSAARYIDAAAAQQAQLAEPLQRFSDAYLRARFSAQTSAEDLQVMRRSLHDVEANLR